MRAQEIAAEAAGGELTVLQRAARVVGLVLVADAPGRLPKALAELSHLVAGGYPKVWLVPWVEAWRLGDPPNELNIPKEVRRMVNDLREMTCGSANDPRGLGEWAGVLSLTKENTNMKPAVSLVAGMGRAQARALIARASALVSIFSVALLTLAKAAFADGLRHREMGPHRQGSGRPSAQSSPGSRGSCL